jgi:hypothetical protein
VLRHALQLSEKGTFSVHKSDSAGLHAERLEGNTLCHFLCLCACGQHSERLTPFTLISFLDPTLQLGVHINNSLWKGCGEACGGLVRELALSVRATDCKGHHRQLTADSAQTCLLGPPQATDCGLCTDLSEVLKPWPSKETSLCLFKTMMMLAAFFFLSVSECGKVAAKLCFGRRHEVSNCVHDDSPYTVQLHVVYAVVFTNTNKLWKKLKTY